MDTNFPLYFNGKRVFLQRFSISSVPSLGANDFAFQYSYAGSRLALTYALYLCVLSDIGPLDGLSILILLPGSVKEGIRGCSFEASAT